jgi:hypothetical protein
VLSFFGFTIPFPTNDRADIRAAVSERQEKKLIAGRNSKTPAKADEP